MLSYITVQALGQARLDEMHEQARRAALAKAARRASHAQGHHAAHRKPAALAGLIRRARHTAPAPESL